MSQSVDPCCPPWQIWQVGRDGTGATLLSDNPAVNDLAPSFSPDGTLIVFTSDRDATVGGEFDVYTMPAPATAPTTLQMAALAVTRLTFNGRVSDPDWGPKPDGPPPTLTLTVSLNLVGRGVRGLVASVPSGILCGRDCSSEYEAGTVVALISVPLPGARFAGWGGACSGARPICLVRMDAVTAVSATFRRR